jgi:hypothetical protein
VTGVDPGVYPLALFDIPLFGGKTREFGFPSEQYRLRQAVGKMKGDVLRGLGAFKVWQISAAVPHRLGGARGSIPGNAILVISVFRRANREIGVPGGVLEGGH